MPTPLRQNDRRALGLLVFHALRKAVETFPEDSVPTDRELQDIFIDTVSLLPGLGALATERLGKVRLLQFPVGEVSEKSQKQGPVVAKETLLDLQPVMDSLRIVWQDYLRTSRMQYPDKSYRQ